ncbi:MAG: PepSY domain-containing protein [Gammaproteobacteria bacterium]
MHDALNGRNLLARPTFWQRWQPAWGIKRSRFNYDLHCASGLWVWPMLLVFALSSVSFNLGSEVYFPTMKWFFDMPAMTSFNEEPPALAQPLDIPRLGWREAHVQAQRLMQALATQSL